MAATGASHSAGLMNTVATLVPTESCDKRSMNTSGRCGQEGVTRALVSVPQIRRQLAAG